MGKGLPILFASELVGNVCGETTVNLLNVGCAIVLEAIKSLKV